MEAKAGRPIDMYFRQAQIAPRSFARHKGHVDQRSQVLSVLHLPFYFFFSPLQVALLSPLNFLNTCSTIVYAVCSQQKPS